MLVAFKSIDTVLKVEKGFTKAKGERKENFDCFHSKLCEQASPFSLARCNDELAEQLEELHHTVSSRAVFLNLTQH